MGWFVTKKNFAGKVPTWRGFICDTVADIATLPTIPAVAPSSECYCSENGITYILETDGDWTPKGGTPSDNSVIFVVRFIEDESLNTSCDKTYNEIFTAFEQGLVLLGVSSTIENLGYEDEYNDYKYGFLILNESESGSKFIFAWNDIDITTDTLYYSSISIDENNNLDFEDKSYTLTPVE